MITKKIKNNKIKTPYGETKSKVVPVRCHLEDTW